MSAAELNSLAESTATARRILMRVASDLSHHTETLKAARLAQDALSASGELLSDLQSRIVQGGQS